MPGSLLLALAAPPPEPIEIVVMGRALEDDEASVLRDVVVLDRAAIERVPSRRIEDVLQQVAGVQTFRRAGSRSAHPTAGGLSMRALGGNAASRALLIVDGVPQQDPFGGWIDFPAALVETAGRITVTRGGGSVRWGPGALAGTVEIDSLGPGDGEGVAASARLGSRESLDGRVRWLGGSGGAYTIAGAAFVRGDGFVPIIKGDRGDADIPAPYEQSSARLRGGIALGSDTELQAGVSLLDDRRARGLRDSDNRTRAAEGSIRLVGRGSVPFAVTVHGQERRFASQFAAADPGRDTSRSTLDQYRVPATGWGARAEMAPSIGALTVRLGADARFGSGETRELFTFVNGLPTRRRIAGGDFATAGALGELSAKLGQFRLEASGRLDHWRLEDGRVFEEALAGGVLRDERPADRDGWETSFRAGAAWAFSGSASLRAAGYSGWRLPTLNELYRPFRIGPDAVAANALLDPERLIGGEVGWSAEPAAGVDLTITAFAARLENAIANVMLGQGPGVFPGVGFVAGTYAQRQNLDSVTSRGIEFDMTARRGPFDARLSASWSRARVQASGSATPLDGERPAQTPAVTIAASGGWTGPQGQRVGATARFVSRQFEDDLGREPLRPALTVGGTISWPVARRLAIEAAVENLLDSRVETGIGGDGAVERAEPRTIWIGLALR
jgi:vitamin B12 transporter